MQIHTSKTNWVNILEGASRRSMIQERGMNPLWRGNGINVLKIAPELAIKFMAYEQIKRAIQGQQQTLHVQECFVAGSPGWHHIPIHHLPHGGPEDVADPLPDRQ